MNFVAAINKLPTIAEYWRVDNLMGNDGIQNTMIRNRFCEILQNLHFADNRKDDKTDKAFKMRPLIEHLNSKLSEVLWFSTASLSFIHCMVIFSILCFERPKIVKEM